MRRSDQLITRVRKMTQNVTFSDDSGIQDDEILQALNDAQDRIYSLILKKNPGVFLKEYEVDAVANQANYSVPSDTFMGTRVERVEFSNSGSPQNYYPLRQVELWERDQFETGLPYLYVRRANEILLQPTPRSGGKIRITYQRTIPKLDKRRAKVASVSVSGNTLTSLVLDTTVELDSTSILDEGWATVIDRDGVVKMKAIPIDAININTGVVTIASGFSFASGETVAVGDWVVTGKVASTNSLLDDVCEKYLLCYAKWEVNKIDSSSDSQERQAELLAIETEIEDAYALADNDIDRIPLISSDFLITDWD